MDRRVIADKLERLRRCMQRIEHKRPPTLATLAADVDLQDILSVNLERAVLLCVDIAAHIIASREVPAPTTMAAAFDALHALHVLSPDLANSMKKAVGFRNIVVHNYQEIDWGIVFNICHHKLDDFRAFAQAIVHILSREDRPG
jgi:uncharacterized protein YutE (UPF0331/DUF86 family)